MVYKPFHQALRKSRKRKQSEILWSYSYKRNLANELEFLSYFSQLSAFWKCEKAKRILQTVQKREGEEKAEQRGFPFLLPGISKTAYPVQIYRTTCREQDTLVGSCVCFALAFCKACFGLLSFFDIVPSFRCCLHVGRAWSICSDEHWQRTLIMLSRRLGPWVTHGLLGFSTFHIFFLLGNAPECVFH
jgi:hypothetical protein